MSNNSVEMISKGYTTVDNDVEVSLGKFPEFILEFFGLFFKRLDLKLETYFCQSTTLNFQSLLCRSSKNENGEIVWRKRAKIGVLALCALILVAQAYIDGLLLNRTTQMNDGKVNGKF